MMWNRLFLFFFFLFDNVLKHFSWLKEFFLLEQFVIGIESVKRLGKKIFPSVRGSHSLGEGWSNTQPNFLNANREQSSFNACSSDVLCVSFKTVHFFFHTGLFCLPKPTTSEFCALRNVCIRFRSFSFPLFWLRQWAVSLNWRQT